MMLGVVSELPEGVEISQCLRDKTAKRRFGKRKWAFFRMSLYGRYFYVPITNEVWKAFGLADSDFHEYDDEESGTGRSLRSVECTKPGVEELLRQLIDAVALQVRDDVLGGIEQSVMSQVTARIEKALHAPIRGIIEQAADERLKRELPASIPKEIGP